MNSTDNRTHEQLAIALARNVADVGQKIMEDNPQHIRERTFLHGAFVKAEAEAFLRRILPPSKLAR